ncbi:MAG: DNA-3-methyladenine glycosylase family protein [Gemmatimonadales bacterium]
MTARPPVASGLDYDPVLACRHLAESDPTLGELIARVGAFDLRPRPTQSLFAAIARAIVYQQLSGSAAATILGRVQAIYAPKRFPTPRDILATPPERLRAAGLSTAKTAALRDLAERCLDRTVPSMSRVRLMQDEEVIQRLIQVRGVGRWTAEMLLMFRLGRADVLPVADLGIRKGFALTFGSRRLPAAVTITRRAERWRPYRSVASWYLWRAVDT